MSLKSLTHTMHNFATFEAQARDPLETRALGPLTPSFVDVAKLGLELSSIVAQSFINGSASGGQVVATPTYSTDPTYVVLITPGHPSCW